MPNNQVINGQSIKQILIVEDDLSLSKGIALALQDNELTFLQCHTLSDAYKQIKTNQFCLVILDINLPDGNGLDLLHTIKAESDLPVILLTANDMEVDVVMGLESGADDYITKPFSLAILRARVNTQIRKKVGGSTKTVIDNFVFDFDAMEFTHCENAIELSKTEQKLLRLLVENKGQTLTRGQLVDRVWSDGAEYVDENALSVTIKRLRDKLEPEPSKPQYIKTVYGLGYVWMVN